MKLPPVEGIPADRPHCARCAKPVKYLVKREYTKRPGGAAVLPVVRRTWSYWSGYPHSGRPLFCTLRCALSFAVLAYEAGYRITPKETS